MRMTTRLPTPAEMTPAIAPETTAPRIGADALQMPRRNDRGAASMTSGDSMDCPRGRITSCKVPE